jgi:hypothetical protein
VSASQSVRTCTIHLRHLHAIVQSLWLKPSKGSVQAYYLSFVAGTVMLRRIGAQAPDSSDTRPFIVLRAVSGQL